MTGRELYNKEIAGEKIRRWQRESGLQGQGNCQNGWD